MDYGALVGGAWRMTWRYRGLWLVGLFAGGTGTSISFNSSGNVPSNGQDADQTFPGSSVFSQANIDGLTRAIQDALPFIISMAVILLLIFMAFWLLAIACSAAVISGGAEAAEGRPVTLGQAWSMGLTRYGSLFRLRLLLLIVGLLVVALFVVYLFTSLAAQLGQSTQTLGQWLPLFFRLAGVFLLAGIVGSMLSVGFQFAERAVVLDGADAFGSLGAGFRLIGQKLGTSILLWLIGVALQIGAVIALLIALVVLALPSALIGGIVGLIANVAGLSGIGVFVGLLGLMLFVGFVVGIAAVNTFLWHYWTLAYLRLTREPVPAAAPTPLPQDPLPETL